MSFQFKRKGWNACRSGVKPISVLYYCVQHFFLAYLWEAQPPVSSSEVVYEGNPVIIKHRKHFRLCLLSSLVLFSSAFSYEDIPYAKFTKLKITSFKIISRETVRVRRTDTMPEPLVSGYRIVEYNFPATYISDLVSHPVKLDTAGSGAPSASGCGSGWGYCIVNGRYKVPVPCGFDIFKKSLLLSFIDSSSTIHARYSLRKLGSFLKEITVSDTAGEQTYDSLINIRRGERR
jgi:hypothetical protein